MVMQDQFTRMVLHVLVKQSFIYCSHAFFGFIKRSTFLLFGNQLQTELEVLLVWILIVFSVYILEHSCEAIISKHIFNQIINFC